ncbi:hypothetical protein EON65_00605 [archaeon]|nr:MAG: hypothetical protein EON65_00605 [archaeon]
MPWKLNKRFAVEDKSDNDTKSSVGKGGKECQDEITVYNRYCHVYKERELEDLCSCLPHSVLMESGYDKGNWYVRLLKRVDDRLGSSTGDDKHLIPTKVIRNRDNI